MLSMKNLSILLIALFEIHQNNGFHMRHDIVFEFNSNSASTALFTLLNLDQPTGRSFNSVIDDTIFDPELPTRIFIHGYFSDRKTLNAYAKAYREAGRFNFIVINWLKGAVTLRYSIARKRVQLVGEAVAKLIDHLVYDRNMNPEDLIIIGHSLGAHAAGAAGRKVKFGRVAMIVGLDPALPCYSKHYRDQRLKTSDADCVKVIHTNSGVLGIEEPMGHIDFYPNFGKDQPGCNGISIIGDICSHQRVHELFLESLKESSQFLATPCASYDELLQKQCTQVGPMELMDGNVIDGTTGVFYISTNSKAPFAKQRFGYNN